MEASRQQWLCLLMLACAGRVLSLPLEGSVFSRDSKTGMVIQTESPRTIRIARSSSLSRASLTKSGVDYDDILDAFSTSSNEKKLERPDIKSLNVVSEISHRYAHTLISSRVANPADVAQEILFSVIIPETAFISGFLMEIDGKTYKAYVKEKEEAQRVYDNAVSQGQAAAHVKQSARDSNRFSVSVNIEPQKKVTFNLTYEELLKREGGVYKHVINLNPGQIVEVLTVDVHIQELRNITKLRAPEIQSGNEVDPELENKDNELADVELISQNEARIRFRPNVDDQKRIEKLIKSSHSDDDKKIEGITGQFAVEYDVDRDPSGGQVLVKDGYFVHFFAPTELPPLKKHVLFVLDVSGSMQGRKIQQLKHAMNAILSELHPADYFNIIEFSYSVTVRNLDTAADSAVYQPWRHSFFYNGDLPTTQTTSPEMTHPFPATPDYIKKAKDIIEKMTAGGGTNIHDALKTAIEIAKRGVFNFTKEKLTTDGEAKVMESAEDVPEPIIIFLTDGEPTVGETRLHRIMSAIDEFNGHPKASIFSLAFGKEADFGFLKKISLLNNGFARQIYEASDASWQLRNFYNQISSPLLSNVTFAYTPDQVEEDALTKKIFHNLFDGSEIVVAGKIKRGVDHVDGRVQALSLKGRKDFTITDIDIIPISPAEPKSAAKPGSLERLWAYLTIKQLLDEQEIKKSKTPQYVLDAEVATTNDTSSAPKKPEPEPKDKALKIALKAVKNAMHSFVRTIIDCLTAKLKAVQAIIQAESSDLVYTDSKPKTKTKPATIEELALKYSFVCPLTSLVVVKPNSTSDVDTESAKPGSENHPFAQPLALGRPNLYKAGPPGQFAPALPVGPFPGVQSRSVFTSMRRFSPDNAFGVAAPQYNLIPCCFSTTPFPRTLNKNQFQPSNMVSFDSAPPGMLTTIRLKSPMSIEKSDVFDSESPSDEEFEASTPLTPTLDSIPWLTNIRSGNEINIRNQTTYKLGVSQPDVPYQKCTSANSTSGVCRHLEHCILPQLVGDMSLYVSDYLCVIPGNYAGVCCPVNSTDESTTVATDTATAANEDESTTTNDVTTPESKSDLDNRSSGTIAESTVDVTTVTEMVNLDKEEKEVTTAESKMAEAEMSTNVQVEMTTDSVVDAETTTTEG